MLGCVSLGSCCFFNSSAPEGPKGGGCPLLRKWPKPDGERAQKSHTMTNRANMSIDAEEPMPMEMEYTDLWNNSAHKRWKRPYNLQLAKIGPSQLGAQSSRVHLAC